MPTCEVCDEEESSVTKCTSCGVMFCEYCGSTEDKLCIECMDYNDEDKPEDNERY